MMNSGERIPVSDPKDDSDLGTETEEKEEAAKVLLGTVGEQDSSSEDEYIMMSDGDDAEDARTRFARMRRPSVTRTKGRHVLKYCILAGIAAVVIALAGYFIHRYGPDDGNIQIDYVDPLSAVEKPPTDKAQYKMFTLENGVGVLLISDNSTPDLPMAVSVNVDAGFYDEPSEYHGLAHFLEHMLFLGSEKYPDENGFSNFISTNGGGTNAMTNVDATNYYFHINQDAGATALDMLAQFFISPSLSKDGVAREMQAVDSEYRNALSNNAFRVQRLLGLMADPASPASRFSIGSLQTLNQKGILGALRTFFNRHYTADKLNVAVWSTASLGELEQMVTKSFSAIPATHSERYPPLPQFPPAYRGQQGRYTTISGDDVVDVYFPMQSLRSMERSRPSHLIISLLSHEANGTVLAKLRLLGWATSLSGFTYENTASFTILGVSIKLTAVGKPHVDAIIGMLFDYLRLIEASGVNKTIWEEELSLRELEFRFTRPFTDPAEAISSLSRRMSVIKAAIDLLAPPSRAVWDYVATLKVVSEMTPDNAIILIGSSENMVFTDHDSRFAFNYSKSFISAERKLKWQLQRRDPFFALPPANAFIPSVHTLLSLQAQPSEKAPKLMVNSPGTKLWWYPNSEFPLVPKLSINVHLYPDGELLLKDALLFHACMGIWTDMVIRELSMKTYSAALAGLSYTLDSGVSSLQLTVEGYADEKPLRLYLAMLLESVFKIGFDDAERFSRSRTESARTLRTYHQRADIFTRARMYRNMLLFKFNTGTQPDKLLTAVESLTLAQLRQFVTSVIRKLTSVTFIHGSISEASAMSLSAYIDGFSKGAGVVDLDAANYQQPVLWATPATSIFRKLSTEAAGINSAVVDIIPIGPSCDVVDKSIANYAKGCSPSSLHRTVLIEFVMQQINDACFDQLRTKEQLGYIVRCGITQYFNQYHMYAVVVSPRQNVTYIESRIQTFFSSFTTLLGDRLKNASQWSLLKSSVRSVLSRQDGSFEAITSRLLSEIKRARFQFNLRSQLLSEFEKVSDPMAVLNFYESILQNRKQLSIQLFSKDRPESLVGRDIFTEGGVDEWRAQQSFSPLTRVSYGS